MFDFENALKIVIFLAITGGMLLGAGFGIKALFFRKRHSGAAIDAEELEGLDERVLRTEAKVAELEERLDFAERMLSEVRVKAPKLNP